jgi:hypothetical protein
MESRTLPRPLGALAELGHPRSAASGRRNRLEPEELKDRVLAACMSSEEKVPLERLVARELTPVCGARSARAWAAPGERKVARAVFHAHTRIFEEREAGANAAIQVPLCDPGPWALSCGLVLVLTSCRLCFSFDFMRNRWQLLLAGRK